VSPPNARVKLRSRERDICCLAGTMRGFVSFNDSFGSGSLAYFD
jgi:hypothetical protein